MLNSDLLRFLSARGLVSMLLLLTASGVASEIQLEPVSLEALVQASPTIVVVEDAEPAHRDIEIPAGTTAMLTVLRRVRVLEVVRAPAGQLSPQQVIEIGSAYLPQQLDGYRMAHDEGTSESPIFDAYEGGVPNTGTRVLMLQPCPVPGLPSLLCLSADGAIEKPENLSSIRALIPGG